MFWILKSFSHLKQILHSIKSLMNMQHYLILFEIRAVLIAVHSVLMLLLDMKFSSVTTCPHGSAHPGPQRQPSARFP